MFDSKEDYERYKAQCIAESKARLLKNNFWIRYLYSEFASNNIERIYEEEREALKQIIKEKLGVKC